MTYPDPLSSGSNISLSSLLSPLSSSSPKGEVRRGLLQKTLLCEFTTRLNILSRKFANYEGLCVAARRADGSIVLLLLADSQNRFRGFLRDWMRTVIIPKQDFSAFL
jgi:hypothetical protein